MWDESAHFGTAVPVSGICCRAGKSDGNSANSVLCGSVVGRADDGTGV